MNLDFWSDEFIFRTTGAVGEPLAIADHWSIALLRRLQEEAIGKTREEQRALRLAAFTEAFRRELTERFDRLEQDRKTAKKPPTS